MQYLDIIMEQDHSICTQYIQASFAHRKELFMYCRYISKGGTPKLFEIRGKYLTQNIRDSIG